MHSFKENSIRKRVHFTIKKYLNHLHIQKKVVPLSQLKQINMKRFNLDEYLKNPERKVITGDGRNVRILCTDRRNIKWSIVALVEDDDKQDDIRTFTKDGNWSIAGDETPNDLYFAPERHEGWVNIYADTKDNSYTSGICIYDTKEEAEKNRRGYPSCIKTIKIEWEE